MIRSLPLILSALLLGAAAVSSNDDPMAKAALDLTKSLNEDQRSRLRFPFDSPERDKWSVVPFGVAGVPLREMEEGARRALRALCASALSEQGLKTLDTVRILDGILTTQEAATGRVSEFHGSERYFITIYGNPEGKSPWGWRFEGHHLSLNVTHQNGGWTSVAPFYVGSQPALVKEGEHKGLRLVGPEDDLARNLFLSFNSEQRLSATLRGTQPTNVVMLAKRKTIDDSGGIPWSELNGDQQEKLTAMVNLWLGRRSKTISAVRGQTLGEEELAQLTFGWIGSAELHAGHYWRIVGAGLTIEHSAPTSDPDHVHTLWRDAEEDLGQGKD